MTDANVSRTWIVIYCISLPLSSIVKTDTARFSNPVVSSYQTAVCQAKI
jgi:hypothetical protein